MGVKSKQKHIYFVWTERWMDGKDLGRNLERKIAVKSWESGMREAVSVP